MTKLKGVNLTLTEGQLKNIGLITYYWNIAEKIQEHLLWVMVPTSIENGKSISTHLSSENRWNIILTLADVRECPKDFIDELKKIQFEFNENRKKRNEVVHAGWAGNEATEIATGFKTSARGSLKVTRVNYTEAQLYEIAKNIEKWTVCCVEFIVENIGWPAPAHIPFFSKKDP